MVGSSGRIPTSAPRVLTGDERGTAGGTALLSVVIGEACAFDANPIDIRGPVAHLAAVIVADVPPADVVSPQDENVRLVS